MKYVVIGGAGAMGRITVQDLVEFAGPDAQIVIADYDFEKAKTQAASYRDHRVSAVRVDVKDRASAAKALQNSFAIINCVQYQLNVHVMEACLDVGAHYIDLGGLFHMTKEQLKLHDSFKAAGKLAILGMGAAPGITNILARVGVDELDRAHEIHTRVANADQTKYKDLPALPVSYSLQTILEEFSYRPAFFTQGKMTFVDPMSGDEPVKFPPPVGTRRPMHTIHSEVATLPFSFPGKGVKEVSFKIAFDSEFITKVKFLRDMGFASHDPVQVNGSAVKPIEVVNKIAMSQTPGKQVGKLKQYEIVRAVVKGTKGKKKATIILDCHTVGMPKWGMGTDINTGCPPAIAAIMLARGEISGAGALPPESVVPPKPFFEHLKKRKMWVKIARKSGWGFKA